MQKAMREETMRLRRLWWAGVEVDCATVQLVIDPLSDARGVVKLGLGAPRTPTPEPLPGTAHLVLITHLHPDHFDPLAIRACLRRDGLVLCPSECEEQVRAAGFRPVGMHEYETIAWSDGPVRVTALPAVDGFGDPQRSWAVADDTSRVFHGGDTLWHGHWWRIAREVGPFDAALLPINGPLTAFPTITPSGVPAALTPEQAATAACLLNAAVAIPIHYDAFHNPPVYVQQPEALRRFEREAGRRGVPTRVLAPGEMYRVCSRATARSAHGAGVFSPEPIDEGGLIDLVHPPDRTPVGPRPNKPEG